MRKHQGKNWHDLNKLGNLQKQVAIYVRHATTTTELDAFWMTFCTEQIFL